MFLQAAELKSVIYQYQLEQITEDDSNIVEMGIDAALEECKSYLRQNNKKEWNDGRKLYDVDLVFSAVGSARNAMLLGFTKTIAVWNITQLCNVDMIHEKLKERYDRAIDYLKKVNKGDITLDLPLIVSPNNGSAFNADGTATKPLPWRSSSRRKFDHEGFEHYNKDNFLDPLNRS